MMFVNCLAYLDQDSGARCGLPAEVRCRFAMRSTDGLLESAMISCPAGHSFSGPIESLAPDGTDDNYDRGSTDSVPAAAPTTSRATMKGGGSALRAVPSAPKRTTRRPNSAPAYYLGHPADLWITVMPVSHRPE